MSTDTDNNGTSNNNDTTTNLSNPFDEFDTVDFKVNITAKFDRSTNELKLDSVIENDDGNDDRNKFIKANANKVNIEKLKGDLMKQIESIQNPSTSANTGGKKSKSKKQKKTKGKKSKSVKRR